MRTDRLSSVVWDEPWAAISACYLDKAGFVLGLAESENRIDDSLNICHAGNSELRLTQFKFKPVRPRTAQGAVFC